MSPASTSAAGRRVLDAVSACLDEGDAPVVLAVSGGMDSMVLLDAAARVARNRIAAVATFDHRSGPHARAAASLVCREAASRGLPVVVGVAPQSEHTEAAWRAARWAFLRSAARDLAAVVATAHTLDDHLETVCMRALRGAGVRGLAGLRAESPILRPLLAIRRTDVAAYAAAAGVAHREDPTNRSRLYLRNRVRHDLLPALTRVQPCFATGMLDLAERAAEVRRILDRVAHDVAVGGAGGSVWIPLERLHGLDAVGAATLAPALAARAGIVLDRRGTTRLSQFILKSRPGARVQLSGGAESVRVGNRMVIRRVHGAPATEPEMPLGSSAIVGAWRIHRVSRDRMDGDAPEVMDDAWTAALPADRALTTRGWRAGDRMRAAGSPAARRVKRFLSDAGIAGPDRIGWPVVLADGEIVWIPGVRRSDAATDRSGRPVLRYRCERNDVRV